MKNELKLLQNLAQPSDLRMLLIVLDGVGGLPIDGATALERAQTPNLDALASKSQLGQVDPIFAGITPGSGIAHLALFGYDPLEYAVGRGAVAAAGVGLRLDPGGVAARCNFVTTDNGVITDRRAGRIGNDEGQRLVEKLSRNIETVGDCEVAFSHVMEYRFAVSFHRKNAVLSENVCDTDPQVTGQTRLKAEATDDAPESAITAELINAYIEEVARVLSDEPVANGIVTRGLAVRPNIPSYQELYGISAQVVASYPDYKGVASLVGMDVAVVEGEGEALEEKVAAYAQSAHDYDYSFFHVKKTDSYGEDRNIDAKVKQIEAFDAQLPRILAAKPDVIAITGDHSTPALMGAHSWHPVPLLLHGPNQRACPAKRFTETESSRGVLGRMPSERLMGMMLAHAGRLAKYGA